MTSGSGIGADGGRTGDEAPPGRAHAYVGIAEVDRFASLRPRIGYALANRLMDELTDRLRRARAVTRIGRVGRTSVEFAFAAPSHEAAADLLAGVLEALEAPIHLDGLTFDLAVTMGAAAAGGGLVGEELLDEAAAALGTARERRGKVHVADGAARGEADGFDEVTVMRDLRAAIADGQLSLYYQPKLKCRSDEVESAEALLRWHHPELGLVRTDKLIDVAEATGAIRELTRWVVARALADRARLAALGHTLTLFVNVSGILLTDAGFHDWVLERAAAAPGALGLEITETAVIADPAVAIAHLQSFAAAGIRLAIDDYGSGLSSLAYLKQLPAHELKIDKMFVTGLTESHRDPLLVRSSIDLAHALEMEVTAEGVDDPLSLSLLRVMGCDMLQGFLISKPLPFDEFLAFLAGKHHRQAASDPSLALYGWTAAARGRVP